MALHYKLWSFIFPVQQQWGHTYWSGQRGWAQGGKNTHIRLKLPLLYHKRPKANTASIGICDTNRTMGHTCCKNTKKSIHLSEQQECLYGVGIWEYKYCTSCRLGLSHGMPDRWALNGLFSCFWSSVCMRDRLLHYRNRWRLHNTLKW